MKPKDTARRHRRVVRRQSNGGGKEGQATEEKKAEPSLEDPAQTVVWGGTLPSRRRAITGGLSGLAIVLFGNLGGVTGALLGLDGGKLAGKLHADVLIPVKGLKRCLDSQNGFEFQYPASWLADQRIFRRNAEKRERLGGLDLPSASRARQRNVAEPVAAFGPAGSTGELNVSVIVAPIQPGFQLSSLGGPVDAGERFLSTTVAPPGSSLEAKLITASERQDDDTLYYTLEYTVRREEQQQYFFRHNISVYAARNGVLYTLNAQSPETAWQENEAALRGAADSFRVNSKRPSPTGRVLPY